jgi:hypothetical protein
MLSVWDGRMTDGLLRRLPTEPITAIFVKFAGAKHTICAAHTLKNVAAVIRITFAEWKVQPQPD